MRDFLLNFVTVLASIIITLAAAELVLNFLPVARTDRPPVQAPTPDNPIQRYAGNTPFAWSLGWNFYEVSHGRSNAQGFIADYDYEPAATTPLVAVAGDSFVESFMLPFEKTLTGQLQKAMGSRGRAYAFAQQGAPLSQYVAYAAHACRVYHPQRLVVVVVGNDFDESLYTHRRRNGIYHLYARGDGGLDLKLTPLPDPPLWERTARHSALVHYLVRNVGLAGVTEVFQRLRYADATQGHGKFVGNTDALADPVRLAEGEKVIDWFVASLPGAACLAPRDIVILVDAMRPEIYDEKLLSQARGSYFGQMRARLIARASAAGLTVIDLEPYFRAAYALDHRAFEYPTDGHWNEHGHAVAAAAVRAALDDWPPLVPGQVEK
jgi:hypothetical protein